MHFFVLTTDDSSTVATARIRTKQFMEESSQRAHMLVEIWSEGAISLGPRSRTQPVVVVGGSLWKAPEVDPDQTVPVYIVKHGPFGPSLRSSLVGVSIALYARRACLVLFTFKVVREYHHVNHKPRGLEVGGICLHYCYSFLLLIKK